MVDEQKRQELIRQFNMVADSIRAGYAKDRPMSKQDISVMMGYIHRLDLMVHDQELMRYPRPEQQDAFDRFEATISQAAHDSAHALANPQQFEAVLLETKTRLLI